MQLHASRFTTPMLPGSWDGSSPGSWLHLQAPHHFHHQRHETKTEPAVSMTLRRRPVTLGHDESQIPKDRLMIFKGNGMIMIMYSCCSSFYGYFCSSHQMIVVHFSKNIRRPLFHGGARQRSDGRACWARFLLLFECFGTGPHSCFLQWADVA